MKFFSSVFFLLFFLINFSSAASLKIKIDYSESVDVFEIMDHLSMWSDRSLVEYRKYWERNIGFSGEDKILLDEYVRLRKKYEKKQKRFSMERQLFSSSSNSFDSFSKVFYSSKSMAESLKTLEKVLTKDEMEFLKKFYQNFKPGISKLAGESIIFKARVKLLEKKLKRAKINNLLKKVSKFFGIKGKKKAIFRILYIWWPGTKGPVISIEGNNLLLRYNPIVNTDLPEMDIIGRQMVKAVSSWQSEKQKENLSKQFFSKCKMKWRLKPFDVLEGPLAVALGGILLEDGYQKKEFDPYRKYTIHPWKSVYSKLLYPLVKHVIKRKENICGTFITKAADICHELEEFPAFLKTRN